MINIKNLSTCYAVHRLDMDDVDVVFQLCKQNQLYYQYCPPFVTRQAVIDDMTALPPRMDKSDKYFLGYYQDQQLIAVIDIIDGYPDSKTIYIGFFMTDVSIQNKGIGSTIINDLCDHFKKNGYQRIELAWVVGNPQAEHFWIKNGFQPIDQRISNVGIPVIAAQRCL